MRPIFSLIGLLTLATCGGSPKEPAPAQPVAGQPASDQPASGVRADSHSPYRFDSSKETVANSIATASLSESSMPRFFPNYVKDCGMDEDASLNALMRERFNTTLTDINFSLFRRDGSVSDGQQRIDLIGDSLARLLGCVPLVASHRDNFPESEWGAYDHFLRELTVDSRALQTAIIEQDTVAAEHWFIHLRQSCAACHARFQEQ